MERVIIIRSKGDKQQANSFSELPYDEPARKIMQNEDFIEYVKKHGYHFNETMAHKASSMMKNAIGDSHSWTAKQVEAVLENHGGKAIYNKCTLGDLTYAANMAYADFYPGVLKDEQSCIKYAISLAADPDGYDGMIFMRWLSDIIGKNITNLEWEC